MSYEIGKFYLVPTVHGKVYSLEREWPVMGPIHEDRAIIGFAPKHYHLDWRFVPVRDFGRVAHPVVYATVLHLGPTMNRKLPKPVMRRRKYIRELPGYPVHVPWLERLEDAHAGCTIKDMICPHRGLPLKGCPQVLDVVTCVGHGLSWNVKTGELVRTPKNKQAEEMTDGAN